CRDPFPSVKAEKRAPTVAHHRDDAHAPERQSRSFSTSQQPHSEKTFSDITDQANCRPPPTRNTADVTKTRILRTHFGDVDAGAQHRDFGKRNGANQKRCDKFQNQNHFFYGCACIRSLSFHLVTEIS